MPRDTDQIAQAEAYEYASDDDHSETHLTGASTSAATPNNTSNTAPFASRRGSSGPAATGSVYALPTGEKLRGLANRIIFSRYYVLFYFLMMCLSSGTVVLSLVATHKKQCPPVVWHILEVVVNGLMVIEVGTRWVAYGKKYPMTLLNIIDLLLVAFCSITLILVFRSPCSEGARQEEVFDTILLVIRNAVQFLRLGNILRRSGHSLLNPPKPIDLSSARTASLALDLDLDLDDEEAVAERHLADGSGTSRRTLVGSQTSTYEPLFEDDPDEEGRGVRSGEDENQRDRRDGTRKPLVVGGDRGREGLTQEDEDAWDRLG